MIRKAAEAHHHSAEQVSQYLDTALRLTVEMDLGPVSPDVFFVQALGLVAAKQIQYEQIQANAHGLVVPQG